MRLSNETKRISSLAAGFSLFMVGILLVAYLLRNLPSPYEACTKRCAAMHKSGQLIYRGPWTSKSHVREADSVCECQ
jgi:hypothetical protein